MLTTICAGGESACLLEGFCEVALVIETDGGRNVGNELVCFLQQFSGRIKPYGCDVFIWRYAEDLSELAVKTRCGGLDKLGKLTCIKWFCLVCRDVVGDGLHVALPVGRSLLLRTAIVDAAGPDDFAGDVANRIEA